MKIDNPPPHPYVAFPGESVCSGCGHDTGHPSHAVTTVANTKKELNPLGITFEEWCRKVRSEHKVSLIKSLSDSYGEAFASALDADGGIIDKWERTMVTDYDPTTEDYLAIAVEEAFGKRCPDFGEYCPCCLAWKQYDDWKGALELIAATTAGGGLMQKNLRMRSAAKKALGK